MHPSMHACMGQVWIPFSYNFFPQRQAKRHDVDCSLHWSLPLPSRLYRNRGPNRTRAKPLWSYGKNRRLHGALGRPCVLNGPSSALHSRREGAAAYMDQAAAAEHPRIGCASKLPEPLEAEDLRPIVNFICNTSRPCFQFRTRLKKNAREFICLA